MRKEGLIAKARHEYIYGIKDEKTGEIHYPSLQEISERHGISLSTLFKRSAKEKWTKQREEHVRKLEQGVKEEVEKVQVERAKTLASEYAEISDGVIKSCKALLALAIQRLKYFATIPLEEDITPQLKRCSEIVKTVQLTTKFATMERGDTDFDFDAFMREFEEEVKQFYVVRQVLKKKAYSRLKRMKQEEEEDEE
ncbi:hypothetical protein [Hydrogenobacter thermophilus]|jgi:hypothetical protein|uniref:hypothetical protein n=1 Tax=Hydrogenobacter thermophilus TaxID=940 RepID=UPI0030F88E31